jgi:hypothetical protein
MFPKVTLVISYEHFKQLKMASKMATSKIATISNKHSELPCYLTKSDNFGVKSYVFRIKEVIED